jgi:hypothetical protein
VPLTARTEVVKGLRQHVLPPLVEMAGITGVHLCLADELVSKIETAEKRARSGGLFSMRSANVHLIVTADGNGLS